MGLIYINMRPTLLHGLIHGDGVQNLLTLQIYRNGWKRADLFTPRLMAEHGFTPIGKLIVSDILTVTLISHPSNVSRWTFQILKGIMEKIRGATLEKLMHLLQRGQLTIQKTLGITTKIK
ncbi:hypothetical protein OX90_27620 [Pseudomonas coronafaciens pv. porri]|uniref:Transposase n=1 Tax=Pseudomonas coronafaciens pv. porri TaxID=83964 RepID=A0ABR5JFR6_9PSED|nr:hypothetical protein OX90_27620 [Pseudomonas coronafaciens pv. porri]